MHKNFKIWKILFFVIFGVNLGFFHYKVSINSSEKLTRQHIFSLLTILPFKSAKSVKNLEKNSIKSSEVGNFENFVIFDVLLKHFLSEHCNYLFIKDYWTTESFLVDTLKHSNPQKSVETLTKNA